MPEYGQAFPAGQSKQAEARCYPVPELYFPI